MGVIKYLDTKEWVAGTITIKSPCKYKTTRGIGIGSLKSEVLKAYQKELDTESSAESKIVAGSIYGGVIFTINKGMVTAIFIGAGAE